MQLLLFLILWLFVFFSKFFFIYLIIFIYFVSQNICQVFQALLIGELLENVEKYKNENIDENYKAEKLKNIYIFASTIVFVQTIYICFLSPYFFYSQKLAMEVRIACSSLIYR